MSHPTASPDWSSLSLVSIDTIFLILLPFYLRRLYQGQVKVFPSWHSRAKSVCTVLDVPVIVERMKDPLTENVLMRGS